MTETVGFVGLGTMGTPMARSLLRHDVDLVVWNRSPQRSRMLEAEGARVADDIESLLAQSPVVLLMLANASAIDEVLGRGGGRFLHDLRRRTVVHLGTTAPAYSAELERDLRAAGAAYVESPVSGSRVPAERGELVGMLAGEPEAVARVRPIVDLMCRETHECGAVPGGLTTKLAVNLFLIVLVTGLAETWNFAEEHGLDLDTVRRVLDAGQMASPISTTKLAKLAAADFEVQAGLADVLYNNVLIADAARATGTSTPLLDVCHRLFADADRLGYGSQDMIGVIHALRSPAG